MPDTQDAAPAADAPAPVPAPEPPLPHVGSGTLVRNDDGSLTWVPDPAVEYDDDRTTFENGVTRKLTKAEVAGLTPPPAPERVLLRKSTVQARAQAAGVLDAIMKVLQSQALLFAQWFAPDWPNVYADDPGLLQVLKGVGCSSDQVAAITAPDPAGPA